MTARTASKRTWPALVAVSCAMAAWALANALSAAAALPANCTQSGLSVTCVFAPGGGEQALALPAGVTSVQVDATGAAGGGNGLAGTGGAGATASASVAVPDGATLFVEVGSAGGTGGGAGLSGAAGANGGGAGGSGSPIGGGGGGGGASDVRTIACGAGCPGDLTSLASRLVVAAGGGGAGAVGPLAGGGVGGAAGASGGNGQPDPAGDGGGTGGGAASAGAGGALGAGGTAIAGRAPGDPGVAGAAGAGGHGGDRTSGGGGGGGGLYGGGGGGGGGAASMLPFDSAGAGGGGGGSSLAPGGTIGVAPGGAGPSVRIAFTVPAAAVIPPPVVDKPAPLVLGALHPAPATISPGNTTRVSFDVSAPATTAFDVAPLLVGTLAEAGGRLTCVALPTRAGTSTKPATLETALPPGALDFLGATAFGLRSATTGGNPAPTGPGPIGQFPAPAGGIPPHPQCRTPGTAVRIATRDSAGGPDAITWDGTAGGRRLASGPYRLSALATDVFGRRSAVSSVKVVLSSRTGPNITRFKLGLAGSGAARHLAAAWDDSQAATASLRIVKLIPGSTAGAQSCVPLAAAGGAKALRAPLAAMLATDFLAAGSSGRTNCTRETPDGAVLTHADVAGSGPSGPRGNSLSWDLRIGGTQAGPGRYRATFVAVNAAGQRSEVFLRGFTIRRHLASPCRNALRPVRDQAATHRDELAQAQQLAAAALDGAGAVTDAAAAGPLRHLLDGALQARVEATAILDTAAALCTKPAAARRLKQLRTTVGAQLSAASLAPLQTLGRQLGGGATAPPPAGGDLAGVQSAMRDLQQRLTDIEQAETRTEQSIPRS